jgi:hypothetical protein
MRDYAELGRILYSEIISEDELDSLLTKQEQDEFDRFLRRQIETKRQEIWILRANFFRQIIKNAIEDAERGY